MEPTLLAGYPPTVTGTANARHRTRRAVLLCCVALLAAAQVAIPIFWNVWAPAGVVWETFGVHYTALPTLALNYHFIGNAMGFAVLYAYAPSLAAHFILDASRADTLQVYWFLIYLTHASFLVATALWMATRQLGTWPLVAVLAISGILPLWLGTEYINVLTPNYFLIATVVLPIASVVWVESMLGVPRIDASSAILIGCAAAFSITSKLTYAIMLFPFLAAPLALAGNKVGWRYVGVALLAFVAATVAIVLVYFAGHLEYAGPFFDDLRSMYTVEYLNQRYEPLWDELTHWPQPRSALQGIAALGMIATFLGVKEAVERPSLAKWLFVLGSATISGLLAALLVTRTAANSFMDAVIFLSFVVAVWTALFLQCPPRRGAAIGLWALYFALTGWQVFGVFKIQNWIARLQQASRATEEILRDLEARGSLPVVYYWSAAEGKGPFWSGEPLWPAPYLYALVSGHQETKQNYLRRYFPGSYNRSVLDGPLPQPHVMVVQEPERKDSPVMRPVFGRLSAFDRILADVRNDCRRHEVEMAWTDFDSRGGSVVTLCSVRAP